MDENPRKIFLLEDLAQRLEDCREKGRRIVQCHGVFDLLHPGHLKHFAAAKQQGDVLVVTLTTDSYVNKGPGRPAFNHDIRAESIAAIGCVDFVAVSPYPTATESIGIIKPDIFVKGGEYADLDGDVTGGIKAEKDAVEAHGGQIHFTQEMTFSSSKLLNTYFDMFPKETQLFLQDFRQRYSAEDVLKTLDSIRGLKVLVIGDAVIDEYCYTRPMGKTSKSNIIASRFLSEEAFVGGVFACANHLAGFCDRVDMITALGTRDSRETFIREHLKSNVTPTFFYRNDGTTTIKRRYLDSTFLAKLFEVYEFEDQPLPAAVDEALRAHLERVLPEYDVVISLDYAHGLLGPQTIELLSSASRFLAVNTQTNAANIGFNPVIKYPRADFVCIDEPELRIASRDRFGSVEPLLQKVVRDMHASSGIVTRGHKGCMVMDAKGETASIAVLSQKVVDAVGAGDAFLAITAPCVAAGVPMEMVGFIGNAVGAQAILVVGNREATDPVMLKKFIKTLLA